MSPYLFRPVSADDQGLIARWRHTPHVLEWWNTPDDGERDPRVSAWIVSHLGRPFAFLQDYRPHDWPEHPFFHLPAGARGLDQFIGEADMLDRGHGTAFLRLYCAKLFTDGVPAIGVDPHPDNARAIRAYQKVGFAIASEPRDTPWGRAVLMELWPSAVTSEAATSSPKS